MDEEEDDDDPEDEELEEELEEREGLEEPEDLCGCEIDRLCCLLPAACIPSDGRTCAALWCEVDGVLSPTSLWFTSISDSTSDVSTSCMSFMKSFFG